MVQRLPERQVDVPAGTPDGYVLSTTGEKAGWAEAPGGGSGIRATVFTFTGTLAAGASDVRLYNDDGAARTILGVRATLLAAPSGGDEVVDVNLDGTTIYTTQANRPTVADGTLTSGKNTDMDVTTWADGSYMTVDVDTHTAPADGLQIAVTFQ